MKITTYITEITTQKNEKYLSEGRNPLVCLLVHLPIFFFFIFSYARRMLYSEETTVFLLAQRHLNTMLLTNFENLNLNIQKFQHFPRNTQFLSFDGPTNYLYFLKNHRQTSLRQKHYTLTFIFLENVVRLVLSIVLL